MSEFEFISVFVSIVLAFAMAELLMGWGRLIRERHRVKHPLLYLGWTCWLLILITFHYLGVWEYQAITVHTTGQMLLLLSSPIILVLLAFVITPSFDGERILDLEKHYLSVRAWFFPMAIAFLVLSVVADVLLPDFAETWVIRSIYSGMLVVTIVWLAFTANKAVHFTILTLNLIILIYGSFARPMI